MKIHNDGTGEAFTAYLFKDYKDQKGNKGAILLEGDILKDFVTEVDRSGFDIHIHAIGDKAINEALNAFEATKKENPNSKNRYTIAHNQMIIDTDLPRYGELGVICQSTPYWFSYLYEGGKDSKITTEPTGDRANTYNRFQSVQKGGGILTFGSDFPATGSLEGMHPLANIEIGITRKPMNFKDAPATPPTDETLSLETMINGYTIDAAYQLKLENEIGSIEVGKKADIVILEENLFDQKPYDIHKNKVIMTMMNGNISFDSTKK
jgi:predicted amidohydrolase YtcJ